MLNFPSEIFDTSEIDIDIKEISLPLKTLDENRKKMDKKNKYLIIQKEKALSKVKLSPIKKPKTPKKIKKMIKNILEWKKIDPDLREENLPQPFRFIKKLLKNEIMVEVYNYVIMKQNNKLLMKLKNENCLVKNFALEKIGNEAFLGDCEVNGVFFSFWNFCERFFVKNLKGEIVKEIIFEEEILDFWVLRNVSQVFLKFENLFFVVRYGKKRFSVFLFRYGFKQVEKVLEFVSEEDFESLEFSYNLEFFILNLENAKKVFFTDIAKKMFLYYESNIDKTEEIEVEEIEEIQEEEKNEDNLEDEKIEENKDTKKEEKTKINPKLDKKNKKKSKEEKKEEPIPETILETPKEEKKPKKQKKTKFLTLKLKSEIEFTEELKLPEKIFIMPEKINKEKNIKFEKQKIIKFNYTNKQNKYNPKIKKSKLTEISPNTNKVYICTITNSENELKLEKSEKLINNKIQNFFLVKKKKSFLGLSLKNGLFEIRDIHNFVQISIFDDFKNFVIFYDFICEGNFVICSKSKFIHFFEKNGNFEKIVYDFHDFDFYLKKKFPSILNNFIEKIKFKNDFVYIYMKNREFYVYDVKLRKIVKLFFLKSTEKIRFNDFNIFGNDVWFTFFNSNNKKLSFLLK